MKRLFKNILICMLIIIAAGTGFAGGETETQTEGSTSGETSGMAVNEESENASIPYNGPINIGTKNFTEQYIVGNLMYILLKDRGYDVDLKTGMSSTVLREAMENGDIDLCMEYTGTQWLSYTGHEFDGETPEEMYQKTKESDAVKGLAWLNPIWCNNTYAIAITNEFSTENNITSLSDFAEYINEKEGDVPFASDFEFYSRPDGILGLQLHYSFAFKPDSVTTVLPGLTFEYLDSGRSVAAMVFGTDPAVVKFNWVVLEDDKNFWPPYDLAPCVNQEALNANQGLLDVLNELIAAFPDDAKGARAEMTALNAKVDIDLLEPEEAAEQWLREKGLIK
jgi:osmoprotectant transport system substrate-binding protein